MALSSTSVMYKCECVFLRLHNSPLIVSETCLFIPSLQLREMLSPFACYRWTHFILQMTRTGSFTCNVRQIPSPLTKYHTSFSQPNRTLFPDFPLRVFECVRVSVTYQHLARYMCSLTNTDPVSRMYQQVAMLSGLEQREHAGVKHSTLGLIIPHNIMC